MSFGLLHDPEDLQRVTSTEKQVLDETGCEVTLRRPVMGWKSIEEYAFLDELVSGNLIDIMDLRMNAFAT
jgi:hypothetical protein